jgi:hypothetical protein
MPGMHTMRVTLSTVRSTNRSTAAAGRWPPLGLTSPSLSLPGFHRRSLTPHARDLGWRQLTRALTWPNSAGREPGRHRGRPDHDRARPAARECCVPSNRACRSTKLRSSSNPSEGAWRGRLSQSAWLVRPCPRAVESAGRFPEELSTVTMARQGMSAVGSFQSSGGTIFASMPAFSRSR